MRNRSVIMAVIELVKQWRERICFLFREGDGERLVSLVEL